ncbi:hypothetical protein CSHISOI_07595 [Colletotrichum shisoi]|uniref:Uncharacterized protein n=1 Tax=Colletotrichum shisoi TaxID=2078593 RepID=A0A5Q4BLJ6_9PEZI|nr:hypothetical protein CSHISOI_07595 [Colletotrichum shisoi]
MLPSAPGLPEGQAVGDPITSSPLSLSTRRSYPPAITFLVELLGHPDKPNIRSHPSIFPASVKPVKPAPRYLYTIKHWTTSALPVRPSSFKTDLESPLFKKQKGQGRFWWRSRRVV